MSCSSTVYQPDRCTVQPHPRHNPSDTTRISTECLSHLPYRSAWAHLPVARVAPLLFVCCPPIFTTTIARHADWWVPIHWVTLPASFHTQTPAVQLIEVGSFTWRATCSSSAKFAHALWLNRHLTLLSHYFCVHSNRPSCGLILARC